ncbi:hypothetical protein IWQ60_012603, partial [Tieghemiomyces parasiticus]
PAHTGPPPPAADPNHRHQYPPAQPLPRSAGTRKPTHAPPVPALPVTTTPSSTARVRPAPSPPTKAPQVHRAVPLAPAVDVPPPRDGRCPVPPTPSKVAEAQTRHARRFTSG